jgi:hypothetical protein
LFSVRADMVRVIDGPLAAEAQIPWKGLKPLDTSGGP